MRRILLLAGLLLAGCASTPRPSAEAPPAEPVAEKGDLIGLTATELSARFGAPALSVPEGDSLKLQFRGPACVLDTYLYREASGKGVAHVTHVDARDTEGRSSDKAGCIAALTRA